VGSALRAFAAWPMLVLGLYMIAALVGSLIPANRDWEPPSEGYIIYIYDNGVHTSLIFPRNVNGFDLGMMAADPRLGEGAIGLPDDHFPGNMATFPYIMVGWGDARFYRDTPTWAEVRPSTALAALVGSGEELLHVDRLQRVPFRNVRKLVLREEEYLRLFEFVSAGFPNIFHGEIEPGYGPDDRFFTTNHRLPDHRYSALFTCNNWVSEALKTAGVKTGAWTPLPFGVMWWHADASTDPRDTKTHTSPRT
jgi:uncharacterized protein (TIGR02117 family)